MITPYHHKMLKFLRAEIAAQGRHYREFAANPEHPDRKMMLSVIPDGTDSRVLDSVNALWVGHQMQRYLQSMSLPQSKADFVGSAIVGALIYTLVANAQYKGAFDFLSSPEYRAFVAIWKGMSEGMLGDQQIFFFVVQWFMLAQHVELHGMRDYYVTPELASQLAKTSIDGICADDLRLPHKSVYIVFPETATFKIYNEISGWHRCEGAYLQEDVVETGERCWRILLIGEDLQKLAALGDDAFSYYRVVFGEDNERVDVILDRMNQEYSQKLSFSQTGDTWREIFWWLFHVILYITHVEPGEGWDLNEDAQSLWQRINKTPKGKKREKLKKQYQGLQRMPVKALGRHIVVNRKVDQNGAQRASQGRAPLTVQVTVSGHWKRVVHGAGRAYRRWQWIAPYIKNKDGIRLSKDYKVK